MKKIKNVIIFSDSHDWHSNQLKKELKKLNCKVSCISLDDCFINTEIKNNIFIPGFTNDLPIVRFLNGKELLIEKNTYEYESKHKKINMKYKTC